MAASPAPAPQAIKIRLSSAVSPARDENQVANIAPSSRGALSRPRGEPNATVTICSKACAIVARKGMRGPGASLPTAALTRTSGCPKR